MLRNTHAPKGSADTFPWPGRINPDSPFFVETQALKNIPFHNGINAFLVLGPRLGGVSTTLSYVAHQFIAACGPGSVEQVWLDCRSLEALGADRGIARLLGRAFRVPEVTTLSSLVDALEVRLLQLCQRINYLVVIDESEFLPPREARWLIQSLHTLQARPDLHQERRGRYCVLVGGSISLRSDLVGIDACSPCEEIPAPILSDDGVNQLYKIAADQLRDRGVDLTDDVVPWLTRTLHGDPLSTQYFFSRLTQSVNDNPSTLSSFTANEAQRLISDPTELRAAFAVDSKLSKALWPQVRALKSSLPLSSKAGFPLRSFPLRLRPALLMCGYVSPHNSTMTIRNHTVCSALDHALKEFITDNVASFSLAAFLSRHTGRPLDDLYENASDPHEETLRLAVLRALEDRLYFCYYATVERVAEDFATLWCSTPSGRDSIIRFPVRNTSFSFSVGESVLYTAWREPSGGVAARLHQFPGSPVTQRP